MKQFPVLKQRKNADIVLLKFERVAVQRTAKIGVLNHGEQETFRDGTRAALSIDKVFDPAENMNV